ncbi:hypothetical protein E0W72_05700 [Flavobacterium arcticum]|uniref:hypothetical protein n=1 Tax=Flavobacterium arcticum TaxID=1784713 RepID=UPI000FDD9FE3|nr:hypothetical protein [Flavobacterium arcticum]KAF2511800.1 hypothetical protein E0W72_05700 [Flavobacterium arcticum]
MRSIRKWCVKNQLPIYRDSSGEFVNEKEFELAYNLPIILRLKNQFGDYWQDYYELYLNGKLHEAITLKPPTSKKNISYTPKGKLTAKIFGESRK